jgi:hypothetical protein
MRGPSLIAGYLDALAGQLPGPVVEELAGGLEETYRRYLGLGLSPEAAARAAVAEFGDPGLIAAEFARAHRPAGPLAGCWRPGRWWGRAGRWRC